MFLGKNLFLRLPHRCVCVCVKISPPTVPTTLQNKAKPKAITHLPSPWCHGLTFNTNVYFEQTSHSFLCVSLFINCFTVEIETPSINYSRDGACVPAIKLSISWWYHWSGCLSPQGVGELELWQSWWPSLLSAQSRVLWKSLRFHAYSVSPLRSGTLPCGVEYLVLLCTLVIVAWSLTADVLGWKWKHDFSILCFTDITKSNPVC